MPMSEAVTVPSLTMMAATVSEDSLARDTHTHRLGSSPLKFAKSLMTLQTNTKTKSNSLAAPHLIKMPY